MIRELDVVVLTRDLPEIGLKAGARGAVVHVHDQGQGFEIDVGEDETTFDTLTVPADAVRLVWSADGRGTTLAAE